MQPIRLPLRCVQEDAVEDSVERVDLQRFVAMFVNQTFREMKDALSRYHSVSETSCRKDLASFFRQKTADFECLFLLLGGVGCLDEVSSHRRRICRIQQLGGEYVRTADALAHLFETFKQHVVPKGDVLMSLQTAYDPLYLLPRLGECAEDREIRFEDIDRLNRVYLQREDLTMFGEVEIRQGITTVCAEGFSFSLALCGDISQPEWKLINVRGGSESFNKHLLFAMPHSLSAIAEFLRTYRLHSRAKDIFERLRGACACIDINVKGYYRKFEAAVHVFRISAHVTCSGFSATLSVGDNVFPAGEDLVEVFEARATEFLARDRENVEFSLGGFAVHTDDGLRMFRNCVDMDAFLGRLRETEVFYGFFEKRFACHRDHRNADFGERNAFVARDGLFVCIRLFGLVENEMDVRVFVGSHSCIDFLVYKEIVLGRDSEGCLRGYIGGRAGHSRFAIGDIHRYFDASMDLLLAAYRLVPLVNGEIEVADTLVLTHRSSRETRFLIEKRDVFVVRVESMAVEISDLDGVCEFVQFALLLNDIEDLGAAVERYRKASVALPGLRFDLAFGSRTEVCTDSLAVRVLFGSMSCADAFDAVCCFHAVLAAGTVPDIAGPAGLVFIFRHVFHGKIRLRRKDRLHFELETSGAAPSTLGPASVRSSSDAGFIEALNSLWIRERMMMVADAAKTHTVSIEQDCVHVSTPAGRFRILCSGNRCMFCIESATFPLDPDLRSVLDRHFADAVAAGRDIPAMFRVLGDADALRRLADSL